MPQDKLQQSFSTSRLDFNSFRARSENFGIMPAADHIIILVRLKHASITANAVKRSGP